MEGRGRTEGHGGQEETSGRGQRGMGTWGTRGQKRKRGTEMVERFVGLEMTLIHRLEVQDKKLEKAVAELMGEAQRLRVQGERIIALLEAEALSGDEEADTEGEDDQAVVAAVTGDKGDEDDEDEDVEETSAWKSG
jgi:hypothetical protein